MITFYSGTPGSGKSLHAAKVIYETLRYDKRSVICSFPVNLDIVSSNGKKKIGDFLYLPYDKMSPTFFYDYALKHHSPGREHQCLVVIDECQLIFNPREFTRSDRLEWIKFFTQHRHWGYDFILISQFDMLVDKQIRCQFEYDVKHRSVNNYGVGKLLPFRWFCAVRFWYCVHKKDSQQFFLFHKKYAKMYDSFTMFSQAKLSASQTVTEGEDRTAVTG